MGRKKRPLSEDDQQLWRRLTERVEPLRPEKKRFESATQRSSPVRPVKAATVKHTTEIPPFRIGSKAKTSTTTLHAAVEDVPAKVSPNMDKRNFQRLLKGQIDIDATLDLHGMTADIARHRLVLFLQQAHSRGARLVLVITGKGKRTHIDEFNRPRSGILREALPDWLRGGALAGLVLQVTQAHPKHGGKGAFYVYLRRRR